MDLEINLFLRACIALFVMFNNLIQLPKPQTGRVWNQLSMYVHIQRTSDSFALELGIKREVNPVS